VGCVDILIFKRQTTQRVIVNSTILKCVIIVFVIAGYYLRRIMMGINAPEPPPTISGNPHVWSLVMEDMYDRDATGKQKYGTHLQPFNGRDALIDAYQEALDLVVYLRQAIYERDNA
jgi:hypothetical protein